MSKSEQMLQIITAAKINAKRVTVLGSWVHIDTFHNQRAALLHLMSSAGFALKSERDGVHLDDYRGFRMVFKVAP